VQGVGFRPFVYRLATDLGLCGWVCNDSSGLQLEVEGAAENLARFTERLEAERPPASVILTREISRLAPAGYADFTIRRSEGSASPSAAVLPDLATCAECLAEILDPGQRRYGYPFTNCTRCGPRYTIVRDLPYDRPNTTLAGFPLCDECRREYSDPADRRFHAQPIACPRCGPRLESSIAEAAAALRAGGIVALKGVGGFQLLCDARSQAAVARLRERKHREAKPLAVMMPSLDAARRACLLSPEEEAALTSPAAPIVLAEPAPDSPVAANVNDASPFVGVMLPYSPLHHLLMREAGFPVVATSGNVSGDPIVTTNEDARAVLAPIADLLVDHDRPIARPVDDSVVRVFRGGISLVRRARGYAPLPVPIGEELPPTLAVGGHQKNTIALAVGRQVFVSQHIGDLDTLASRGAFVRAIDDLCRLYRTTPERVVCDLHPDYGSTQWARTCGLPVAAVQHHVAHAASCAAENDVREPYLAVTWDGAGYGTDGAVWGGEFFWVENGRFSRVAWLRPFRLPGGEAAIREPWRVAEALRWEIGDEEGAPGVGPAQRRALRQMLARRLNCPSTTSMGRLFDAAAALAGIAPRSRFEGHAAMLWERIAGRGPADSSDAYEIAGEQGPLDWEPLVRRLIQDAAAGVAAPVLAARFHSALPAVIVRVARACGARVAVLSGGCFQNARLTTQAVVALEAAAIRAVTHQRVPANDGGLALGQAVLAWTEAAR